jgi:hypothetical protein
VEAGVDLDSDDDDGLDISLVDKDDVNKTGRKKTE